MSRKRFLWTLPLVGVLAVVAIAVFLGASPGDKPPQLTGENVTEYDHSDSFVIKNPTRSIEQGEVVDGGCKFTTRLEKTFDEPAKVARTISADFSTCERLVEKGTIDPETLEDINEEEATESIPAVPSESSSSTENTGRSRGLLASPLPNQDTVYETKFKTRWEDPPPFNIDVNWVRSELEWTIDGDTVVFHDGRCRLYWRSGTGWTNEGGGPCNQTYNSSQTVVTLNKTSHAFDNDSFPCFQSGSWGYGAETNYTNNKVNGTLIGSSGTSSTTASGDCAYLLHSSQILE